MRGAGEVKVLVRGVGGQCQRVRVRENSIWRLWKRDDEGKHMRGVWRPLPLCLSFLPLPSIARYLVVGWGHRWFGRAVIEKTRAWEQREAGTSWDPVGTFHLFTSCQRVWTGLHLRFQISHKLLTGLAIAGRQGEGYSVKWSSQWTKLTVVASVYSLSMKDSILRTVCTKSC